TLDGLHSEGLVARGVLFLGIMWTSEGPKLLEYNCRFGDPEARVLMAMMNEPLLPLLLQVAEQRLSQKMVEVKPGTHLTYVLASAGYPDKVFQPVEIPNLPIGNPSIIHAGTKLQDHRWFTHGGRVLNVVVSGKNLEQAQERGKLIIGQVAWFGMQYRPDIGEKALRHHRAGKSLYDLWS
ncbi:MAG: phosphoribosylglycinamide synthetase C domain-containing protein, partial [Holophagaceae bacterium]